MSQRSVWMLLDQLGYSMQSNRKTKEGTDHPDRDAQFLYIANKVQQFQQAGFPIISVYQKKGADRSIQKWRSGMAKKRPA